MKLLLLAKAGAVLREVCAASKPMTLKELSAKLKLPLPTLSRICNDLVEMDYLEKTSYHHFSPSLALVSMGYHAMRLSPFAASAKQIIRKYSVDSGLNGLLSGYDYGGFYRICSCSSGSSDSNVCRRSGAYVALLSLMDLSLEQAMAKALLMFPDLTDVEKNAFEREFESLKHEKCLLRVGIMRQWFITVPYRHNGNAFALTYYGVGRKDKSVEAVSQEVIQVAAKICSAWNRLSFSDSGERD